MKKRNAILTAMVALTLLTASSFAYAGARRHARPAGIPGDHRGPAGILGMFGRLEHVKEELGLSDAQAQQIRGIFKDLREKNATYRDQLHGGYGNVATVLLANPNDLSAAQALLDKQSATEKAMKDSALVAASKAIAVLTPEQRTKLGDMLSERAERRANRRRG